jgi:FkbM family methyltransferase
VAPRQVRDDLSDLPKELQRRVLIGSSGRDCDDIPKVADAGACFDGPGGPYQVMHNGVKVRLGCYQGDWMVRLITRLRGHHEPQEEKVFHTVCPLIRRGGVMVEMGAFWAYYSLWFSAAVHGGRNVVVEPDPNRLEIASGNFALNGRSASFVHARAASRPAEAVPHFCDSDRVSRLVPEVSVDDLARREGIDYLDLLHADIQGAELRLLEGMGTLIREQRVRFVFLSTHHHSICGDPLIHQKCLRFLRDRSARILAEHTVGESFSGDGLIVASFAPGDRDLPVVPLGHNRACSSLFGEPEAELARAWEEIEQARLAIEQLRRTLPRWAAGGPVDAGAKLPAHLQALEEECRRAARPVRSLLGNCARRSQELFRRVFAAVPIRRAG